MTHDERDKTYYDTLINALPNCAPCPTVNREQRLFQGNLRLPQWTNNLVDRLPTKTFRLESISCVIIIRDLEGSSWYAEDLREMLCSHLFFALLFCDYTMFEAPARNILWQRTENKDGSLGVIFPPKWNKPIELPPKAEFHVKAFFAGPLADKTRQLLNAKDRSPYRCIQVQLHGHHVPETLTLNLASASGTSVGSVFGYDSTTHCSDRRPDKEHRQCQMGYTCGPAYPLSATVCGNCSYTDRCPDKKYSPLV